MDEMTCRGSWRLGSACGHCRRCVRELLLLLTELTWENDPCSYDHNGLCQSHNLHEKPCPHESAKHAITTAKSRLNFRL